ncbi:DUF192 domain-containing protein [Aquabacterium sp. NJ1]|uniref:DUF192 domain-containing protein n=1 Tax=Aquabacterium sp. NJ1 TaxID=1538295 RepID=UPI00068A62CB|nr:DUF192 domain-containing protein [Aquabacterium sp. NJ1]
MSRIVFQVARLSARATAAVAASLAVLGFTAPASALAQDRAQHLPTVMLGAGMHNIKAEVAETPQEHEIGLMYRTAMGANEGMLFIFERAGQQCFWMKNTLIPLAVAFVADDGTVVNVDEMKPQTLDPHCSTKPVRFVLEMNTGWFTKRGFKEGSKLSGAPFGTPR